MIWLLRFNDEERNEARERGTRCWLNDDEIMSSNDQHAIMALSTRLYVLVWQPPCTSIYAISPTYAIVLFNKVFNHNTYYAMSVASSASTTPTLTK